MVVAATEAAATEAAATETAATETAATETAATITAATEAATTGAANKGELSQLRKSEEVIVLFTVHKTVKTSKNLCEGDGMQKRMKGAKKIKRIFYI